MLNEDVFNLFLHCICIFSEIDCTEVTHFLSVVNMGQKQQI